MPVHISDSLIYRNSWGTEATRALFDDFARSLALADTVLLPEIFYARESADERARVSSRDLAAAVRRLGAPATYVKDVSAATEAALTVTRPGDVVLVMGAGDIAGTAARLVGALRARALAQGTGLAGLRRTPSGRTESVGAAA